MAPAPSALEQGQLDQQLRTYVADVLDRRLQPAAHVASPALGGAEQLPLRSPAGLDRLRGDQLGRLEPAERAIDHRAWDLPDPTQRPGRRGQAGHREAVRGGLVDDGEDDPLGQGQRRLGGHARQRGGLHLPERRDVQLTAAQ